MPDTEDYEWLGWLVEHPEAWSEDDAAKVRFLIARQRAAIDEAHPRDELSRRRYQGVIDDLERALDVYRQSRA